MSNLFYYGITLHVSDGLSVHHQEFTTVRTATCICQTEIPEMAKITSVCMYVCMYVYIYIYTQDVCIYIYIQDVPGGMCQTLGECSLC